MRILIIEDEKITAKDLSKTILSVEPDAEIVEILHSVEDALVFFKQNQNIDLIFSDIELGDGLSFEIFEKANVSIPVIFCTAYNEYALEAFKVFGIDYILKPFSKNTVGNALEKYFTIKDKFSIGNNEYSHLISALKNNLNPSKLPSIIIQQKDKILPISGENIAVLYIEDDYVFAYTFEQKTFIISQKLDSLEKTFSPFFFRANRQFLINRKAVKDASHHFNRKVLVNLNLPFKYQIIIGKLKITSFIDWLSIS